MLLRTAKALCPTLRTVPYDFPSYQRISAIIYTAFFDTAPVEAVSVDEAYLDITSITHITPEELVASLRARILAETSCPASAGIGPSKLLARLATKLAKPDGQLRVKTSNVSTFLDPLPASHLPGVGRRTERRLKDMSVHSVEHLRNLGLARLQTVFGQRQGRVLYDMACGRDDRPVLPLAPRRSIGAEASWGVRFESNETEKLHTFLRDMATEVASRVADAGATGSRVVFKAYRRVPNSSMSGYKHLGHGPCTIISKSARLPSGPLGRVLGDACLSIWMGLRIPNELFRGVGVQVTDLSFGNLSFEHSTTPVVGNSRIDSFFTPVSRKAGTNEPKKENKRERPLSATDVLDKDNVGNPTAIPLKQETVVPSIVNEGHSGKLKQESDVVEVEEDEDRIEKEWPSNSRGKRGVVRVPNSNLCENGMKKNVIEDRAIDKQHRIKDDIVKVEQELLSEVNIPKGWDRRVFQALPAELQVELLTERRGQIPIERNVTTTCIVPEAGRGALEPVDKERSHKRKKKDKANQAVAQALPMKKGRHRQAEQVTMTQFADISELRKTGNDMLNAAEFRERPLKECVELLEDLKPMRGSKALVSRHLTVKPVIQKAGQGANVKVGLSGEVDTYRDDRYCGLDIPSPPCLSSDSSGSYGLTAAIERQCYNEKKQIYEDEKVCDVAPKLKMWMVVNATGIKTGHVELLRGRILELVRLNRLKGACSEMRMIRKFAEEDESGGWLGHFNKLLQDVQNETKRIYGFTLAITKLNY